MAQIVIKNPILNSPFEEPQRHWRFGDEGITDDIVEERRISSYFVPIAKPRKKGKDKQMVFDTEWTKDRIKENAFINRIRSRVRAWREGDYVGITKTTRRLLEYWTNPEREKKLFFCQIEALETAIYIGEAARNCGDTWIENDIRQANEYANPSLYRIAFKMATGSGKTVVMGMFIAWQALNKIANAQNRRFSDTFLIVTPGITIRDRLRVLLPNDPNNYYRQRDLLPPDMMDQLGRAKILITNFHAFLRREKIAAGKLTKSILDKDNKGVFHETRDQMVRRVCRELGNKKNIVVINDEAHHCYRGKPEGEEIKLKGDARKEAQKRDEAARVWLSGLEAVKAKIAVKAVYDLSATPFFLRGSGYSEGTLFPWVVSDFSLVDAIECGIVKVPRVPVADDSMTGEQPTYRDLWIRIREHLPKKGRKREAVTGEPKLPVELEGALRSLYGNYEKYYRDWENDAQAQARGSTPPVFIVVCNNTNVSKLVFDWVAGWEKTLPDDSTVVVPGQLSVFSNEENGGWTRRPNTILIDSQQLESGEAMSKEFKKIAATEIEEFKAEYRERFPARDPENLTDEDLLREVMNTVGKTGKLGENIRCVVSVSMLTEGWDANTVTHILGVRAFSTQLLCEQVVGRGLRRKSYVANADGKFEPEYAEVYGVPFSFIPCSGSGGGNGPGPVATRVRALEERTACEITFPRVSGYRYDLPGEKLTAKFGEESHISLSTADIPSKTENAPIVGETSIHTLDDLKGRRQQEIVFVLSKLVLEEYFRDDQGNSKPWLFPQLLSITKRWLEQCVTLKDNTFIQLLLLTQYAHDAADRIYRAIVAFEEGEKALKPILQPYSTIGSTKYVDFDTTREVYPTDEKWCHISHVVADTESWEQKMAQALEELGEDGLLVCYVKNQGLGFLIPYTVSGQEHNYMPDFIVRLDDGNGPQNLLNLIVEVTGAKDRKKAAKVATARNLWVPAINNHGAFGRWDFIEITDPWDAKNTISAFLPGKEAP
ncbi:MAG: DEAD/DEAH box helicase family protein [Deltaproteobacteria bacterium]|nr:DEAD/DEAH box helicase family protein [Deltaproteobacteria bacterium]